MVFHDGDRLTGEVKGLDRGQLRLSTDAVGTVSIEWARLVSVDSMRMDPIDQGSLIARLDGYVTAGYDYTKANELQTFTFTGGLSFRDERVLRSLDGSATVTSQETAEDSSRYDVTANNRRFLANRLFYQGSLSFDGNVELGLELAEAGRWIEVLVGERGAQSSHDC